MRLRSVLRPPERSGYDREVRFSMLQFDLEPWPEQSTRGCTPVADAREVLARLATSELAAVTDHGVRRSKPFAEILRIHGRRKQGSRMPAWDGSKTRNATHIAKTSCRALGVLDLFE